MTENHAENTQKRIYKALHTTNQFAALLAGLRAMNQKMNTLIKYEPEGDQETKPGEIRSEETDHDDGQDEDESDVTSIHTKVACLAVRSSNELNQHRVTLLQAIAQDLDISKKSSNSVDDELSNILNSLLTEKIADAKLQSNVEKYPRPTNSAGL